MKKLFVICFLGIAGLAIASSMGARPVLAEEPSLEQQLGINDINGKTVPLPTPRPSVIQRMPIDHSAYETPPNKRIADAFADLVAPDEHGFQPGLQMWADTYLAGPWGVNGSFFPAKEWPPEAAYARGK